MDFKQELASQFTGFMNEFREQVAEISPAPELNRKNWKRINQSGDQDTFLGYANTYGKERTKRWVLTNQMRDEQERANGRL